MKSRSGFTIIELFVVITVIGILATIAGMAYSRVQAEGRDAKRKADITLLANLFEKYYEQNGEYPTGCSRYGTTQKVYCKANHNQITDNPDAFYLDTPLATIQSAFPGIPDDFGDPSRSHTNQPFRKSQAGKTDFYFYMGQYDSTVTYGSGGGVMGPAGSGSEVDCQHTSGWISLNTPAGPLPKSSTFALGYWSEVDKKWYIYQGQRGIGLQNDSGTPVRGTTIGRCTFVQ